MEKDIRWEQRFSNYVKALDKLRQAVEFIKKQILNEDPVEDEDPDFVLDEIIKEGLIRVLNILTN